MTLLARAVHLIFPLCWSGTSSEQWRIHVNEKIRRKARERRNREKNDEACCNVCKWDINRSNKTYHRQNRRGSDTRYRPGRYQHDEILRDHTGSALSLTVVYTHQTHFSCTVEGWSKPDVCPNWAGLLYDFSFLVVFPSADTLRSATPVSTRNTPSDSCFIWQHLYFHVVKKSTLVLGYMLHWTVIKNGSCEMGKRQGGNTLQNPL